MGRVGHVQAEDVHAGINQLADHGRGVCRGSQG
jgi:hypothetical protein